MRQKKVNTRNKNKTLINEEIRSREVRLINAQGEQEGVVATSEALNQAYDLDLDLVMISNGDIPVAKIIDFGKFRFEQQKKLKENKANQKNATLKEVRVSPTIDTHDFDVKMKQARKFLANGDKVQFALRFRGRMITHAEIGREVLNRVMEELKNEVVVDQYPKMNGRRMFLVVSPIKK